MKYFTCQIILSIVLSLQPLQAGTPVKYTSGSGIIFATNLVNGETYYSYADASNHWGELGLISSVTVVVTTFTPAGWELNLSTCTLGFDNYSDWFNSQTRSGLRDKIGKVHHQISGLSFDQTSPQYINMVQRKDWLKSYYQTLP